MEVSKWRVVLWCGSASNQKSLACKIAANFTLEAIVIDEKPGGNSQQRKWSDIPFLVYDRLRFRKIYNAWKNLMTYYDQQFSSWPEVPTLRVAGINNKEAFDFTKAVMPDLIIVSGTGLVKEPMLSCPSAIGIINLHTGLSPYVKGGPNCTNWCIANNDWHLVGNTIMWLNAGIDSGNIITTDVIDIRDAGDLNTAHIRVMNHAHELYLKAIRYLLTSQPPYNSISQKNIAKGELFLTKMWTPQKRRQFLVNWRNRKKAKLSASPITISIPEY